MKTRNLLSGSMELQFAISNTIVDLNSETRFSFDDSSYFQEFVVSICPSPKRIDMHELTLPSNEVEVRVPTKFTQNAPNRCNKDVEMKRLLRKTLRHWQMIFKAHTGYNRRQMFKNRYA